MSERRFYWIIGLLLILAITIPYLYAAQAGGSEYVFGGFFLNVQDGNSYLAKMYQGWRGDWRFKLPYTADPGKGGYINLFYLGLGHVARILNVSLLLAFHGARVIGTGCLLWALSQFFRSLFQSPQRRKLAFAISALGSGLGWLATFLGITAADFSVPEAYPFYSTYINPHFAFGLALTVWIITPRMKKHPLWTFLASLALAIIAPFGVVIVVMVLSGMLLLEACMEREHFSVWVLEVIPEWWNLGIVLLGGGPMLIYQYWISNTDPVLKGWNVQNLTIMPPFWEVLIGLSPVFILAILGLRRTWLEERIRMLILWAGLDLVLIYMPLSLQRRFIMGLFIPLVGLAVIGIEWLGEKINLHYRTLVSILFILSLPTNLMLIFSCIHVAHVHETSIYLTTEEFQALGWIEEHTPSNALVLTGPETGQFVPAHTGRRVLYGHSLETVDATTVRETVTAFFSGEMALNQAESLLDTQDVDYILIGPRERELGEPPLLSNIEPLFSNDTIEIYGVLP